MSKDEGETDRKEFKDSSSNATVKVIENDYIEDMLKFTKPKRFLNLWIALFVLAFTFIISMVYGEDMTIWSMNVSKSMQKFMNNEKTIHQIRNVMVGLVL